MGCLLHTRDREICLTCKWKSLERKNGRMIIKVFFVVKAFERNRSDTRILSGRWDIVSVIVEWRTTVKTYWSIFWKVGIRRMYRRS